MQLAAASFTASLNTPNVCSGLVPLRLLNQHFCEFADYIITGIGWHKVDALDYAACSREEFLGNFKALIMSMFASCTHSGPHLFRDSNARYFVMQIFGMARTMHGDTSRDERNRWFPGSFLKAKEGCQFIDGLGHNKLRARFDF